MCVARVFVLLMRYSGRSIQDAATLARERLEGTLLTLRRGESEELVQVDLPEPVVEALRSLPVEGRHYFWTGKGAPASAPRSASTHRGTNRDGTAWCGSSARPSGRTGSWSRSAQATMAPRCRQHGRGSEEIA